MPLILGTNSIKDTGFNVANSCRFNDGSSDSLTRSLGASETSTQKGTFSYWIKRSTLSGEVIISNEVADNNNRGYISFNASDNFRMVDEKGIVLATNAVYRDTSAWYHFVIALDSTLGTTTDRVKLYVNGVRETSFQSSAYFNNGFPDQNINFDILTGGQTNKNHIGKIHPSGSDLDAYLAEFVYIDGQQLDPTSFGEFDEDSGIWKPIDVSGLTFGTNGFYLDFENSGSLGADVSGNGNNFTVNNLTAIDQSTDTCTNNYCTLNPLDPTVDITLSEGNLKGVYGTSGTRDIQGSTFGVSSGKWYWEIKIGGAESPNNAIVGVTQLSTDNEIVLGGATDNSWGYRGYDGEVFHNNSSVASYATFDGTSIIGIYLDLDNHKLYFSKDGSLQSATGISLDTGQDYFPAISDGGSSATPSCEMNFGSPSFSISSGNTDANGYGNFEYSATITGDGASKNFLALNTKNLSEVLG